MMKALSSSTVRTLALASLLLTTTTAFTQEPPAQQATRAADNSKVNDRDQSGNQPTADQQKNGQSDLELTRQIRRSIVQDASLSTYAHNVKIIAQDGKVTLKGPVRSEDEKQAIEAKATEVAGKDNVVSELSIAPANK
jgi:hyperosmotically inducible periplasmic protein